MQFTTQCSLYQMQHLKAIKSWEGRNTYLWIYALNLFIEHSGEHWWEQNIFCSFTTPQAFLQSSAPGALSSLVTSVVLYSLTRATPMSPGKDETRACGYIYAQTKLPKWLRNMCKIKKCNHFKFHEFAKQTHSWIDKNY